LIDNSQAGTAIKGYFRKEVQDCSRWVRAGWPQVFCQDVKPLYVRGNLGRGYESWGASGGKSRELSSGAANFRLRDRQGSQELLGSAS